MRAIVTVGISFLLLAAFIAALPVQTTAAKTASSTLPVGLQESEGNFSIIWITDTQYLSESRPMYYDSLCRWIVDNAAVYDVKMVVHTGDLVEDEWNQTQWENANKSMSILLDNGVPYCWNAGNHDYNATYWIGNQYNAFNPSALSSKPYWLGDMGFGQSTAVHFSVSGWNCLIVNLAYQANDDALAWANSLLDDYSDSHAIVATHAYLNDTGGYGGKGDDNTQWPVNFRNTVLETHASVFLTLSAHFHPTSGSRTRVEERDELMFNRQDSDSRLGAASLRILTFDTTQGLIDVKTFLLYANDFLADSKNQFTLNTTFHNDDAGKANIPLESGETFPTIAIFAVAVIIVVCAFVLATWRLRKNRSKSEA